MYCQSDKLPSDKSIYIYIYIYTQSDGDVWPKWSSLDTKLWFMVKVIGLFCPKWSSSVIGWCMTKVMEIYMAKVISLPGWISICTYTDHVCVYIYVISHIRVSEHSPCVLDKCVKGLWCSLLRPGVLPSVDRSCNQWYILFAFYMYRNAVRMLFIVYYCIFTLAGGVW